MSIPKRKNDIKIYKQNDLSDRRKELLSQIINNDTFLPESVLHDDLDRGMLDYIIENFKIVSNGSQIPIIPKILTIQRWGEISNTWEFIDDDNNIKIPFISIVRKPDVQPGTNPSIQRTIPDRRTFHYRTIPTWDGTKKGFDIYKMPQPVAVDISYEVSIITTELRDLNKLNKVILQKFSSRQSYTTVKGHYIPIVLDRITDNTQINSNDNRKFYNQNYSFTLLGLLIDDEEFEIIPGIDRTLLLTEFTDTNTIDKKILEKIIDVNVVTFKSNGEQTTFRVGESINFLFYVAINGLLQDEDNNYYHIPGTSKIIFVESPPEGSIITISYIKGKSKIINNQGKLIVTNNEVYTYVGDLSFIVQNNIKDVIAVTVNGIIEKDGSAYVYHDNVLSFNINPSIDSQIGITYTSIVPTITDVNGKVFMTNKEYFRYVGNNLFTLNHIITDIIYITVNGVIEDSYDGYDFNKNILTINKPIVLGSQIGISYIY